MPSFGAKEVQALRQKTGVGMMDAKRALQECDGDGEQAAQWLRKQGLTSAAKRDDRNASEGAIAIVREGPVAAIVEMRCETDFVAKSADFVSLADEIAALVVSKGQDCLGDFQDAIDNLRVTLKENISPGRVERVEAQGNEVLDTYLHVQAGRGINAVAVVLAGGTDELAHDLCVHIAFTKPKYLSKDEVPSDDVAREKAVVEEISRAEGKPEAALEKIVEGRMRTWFKEQCLLEQSFVRNEKQTIQGLLGDAKIVRFVQVLTKI